MAITETLAQIKQAQQQAQEQEAQVAAYEPKLKLTAKQLRQATPITQERAKSLTIKRQVAKQEALVQIGAKKKEVEEYKQQVEEYLSTPQGIREYASENNIKPSVTYRQVTVGTGEEKTTNEYPVYTYNTPYGSYTDDSKYRQALGQAEMQLEIGGAKYLSQQSQLAVKYSAISGKIISTKDIAGIKQSLIQTKAFSEAGLKPIVKGGEIISFKNIKTGEEYTIENIPLKSQKILEQAKILTPTTQPKVSPIESYKNILFGTNINESKSYSLLAGSGNRMGYSSNIQPSINNNSGNWFSNLTLGIKKNKKVGDIPEVSATMYSAPDTGTQGTALVSSSNILGIVTTPYIYSKQIGNIKSIPAYEIREFTPFPAGQFTSGISTDILATPEQQQFFLTQNELKASEQKAPFYFETKQQALGLWSAAKEGYQNTKLDFLPTKEKIFGTPEERSVIIAESQKNVPDWLKLRGWEKKTAEFGVGTVAGIYEDVREKPMKQAVLWGAGYLFGYGAEATVAGATKFISPLAGSIARAGITTSGLYLGGVYAVDVGKKIIETENYGAKGEIFGTGVKDISLIGWGYGKGQKGFIQTRGWWNTRGREFLETKQGEYPQANPNTQLNLFRKNIIPQLGEKPGAFHTTSDVFWKSTKTITPQTGTSELPGLYGATDISTPFARIPGSGSKQPFSFMKSFTQWFPPSNAPGVAYLKPEGFREVSYGITNKPTFEGQASIKGKYAYFKTPAKSGTADVPKMKSEIETIFRTDAGSYGFESGKYYTNINGVRVPIDVFKYDAGLKGVADTGVETLASKGSSYNYPRGSYRSYPGSLISISPSSKVSSTSSSTISSKVSSVISDITKPSSNIKVSRMPSSISISSSNQVSSLKSSLSQISSINLPSSKLSSTSRILTSSLSSSRKPPTRLIPIISISGDKTKILKSALGKISFGYKTFILRKGKKEYLAGIEPRAKAIRKGERIVLGTLAATFGIEKMKTRIAEDIDTYAPSTDIFRGYKIKGRAKIPLENIWIQKAGTRREPTRRGARLAARGEVRELLSFKRKKGGYKWF